MAIDLNGSAVRSCLHQMDRTLSWLSTDSAIHRPTLYKYLNGERRISNEHFDALCESLNVEDPMILVGTPDREGALVSVGVAIGVTPSRYAELYKEQFAVAS